MLKFVFHSSVDCYFYNSQLLGLIILSGGSRLSFRSVFSILNIQLKKSALCCVTVFRLFQLFLKKFAPENSSCSCCHALDAFLVVCLFRSQPEFTTIGCGMHCTLQLFSKETVLFSLEREIYLLSRSRRIMTN